MSTKALQPTVPTWEKRVYDPALFTQDQVTVLVAFETETGFVPQTAKFECGQESFWLCYRKNVQWFHSWAADTAARLRVVEPKESRSPFAVKEG